MKSEVFAQRLQIAMYWKEWTGAELARQAGVTAATISRYICGQRQPNVARLVKLSKALEVSTDYLLGLSDAMRRSETA